MSSGLNIIWNFCRSFGVSSSSITRILCGERPATPEMLRKMADRACNDITYDQLMQAAYGAKMDARFEEISRLYRDATEDQRDKILEAVKLISDEKG